MRLTGTTIAIAAGAALGFVAAIAVAAFLSGEFASKSAARVFQPVWTEANWPFPADPWGKGKAFRCKAADCGSEVQLYVRAKLGFCNCVTGIADDTDLEQMGDLAMIGGQAQPLGAGRPITVGSMPYQVIRGRLGSADHSVCRLVAEAIAQRSASGTRCMAAARKEWTRPEVSSRASCCNAFTPAGEIVA